MTLYQLFALQVVRFVFWVIVLVLACVLLTLMLATFTGDSLLAFVVTLTLVIASFIQTVRYRP